MAIDVRLAGVIEKADCGSCAGGLVRFFGDANGDRDVGTSDLAVLAMNASRNFPSAALVLIGPASVPGWLAVDETNGRIGVIYYDTVGDATRRTTNVWYQSSANDGSTWSVPLKVSTGRTDETGGGAELGNQYGDYNSLSGFMGKFFPSWTDRRGGGREGIWTAPIADP